MSWYRLVPILVVISVGLLGLWGCGEPGETDRGGTFNVESAYIQESGDHLDINAEYPVVSGFPGAEQLNSEIKEKVDTAAQEVRDAALELENREGFSATLNSNYQYFANGDMASIWISYDNYTGGAHGMYWLDSYTLNVDTGGIYSFPELFQQDSGGVEYVTASILKDIGSSGGDYFDSAAETVVAYEGNYNFLINGDALVVYFPLYDIAPYVAGIQHFDFTAEDLIGLLKPEIYDAIRAQESFPIPFLAQ